jgi:outer membrane protein assembly factor BamB
MEATTAFAADWRQFGFNAQHTGDNPAETTLTRSNVSHLVQAYSTSVADLVGTEPIVVGGIEYASGGGGSTVFAIDATTGTPVWTNFPGAAASSPVFGRAECGWE